MKPGAMGPRFYSQSLHLRERGIKVAEQTALPTVFVRWMAVAPMGERNKPREDLVAAVEDAPVVSLTFLGGGALAILLSLALWASPVSAPARRRSRGYLTNCATWPRTRLETSTRIQAER
jgi:hypothetical protein